MNAQPDTASLAELLSIMARLRDRERGCPWDLEQTFATIAPYTIEEAYEVADAIARNDLADLEDELGDLLFQVVFHARMAEEAGAFDFSDVARAICAKMLRRHPHVFEVPLVRVLQPGAITVDYFERHGARLRTYELRHERFRIWGATAAILHDFREVILDEREP